MGGTADAAPVPLAVRGPSSWQYRPIISTAARPVHGGEQDPLILTALLPDLRGYRRRMPASSPATPRIRRCCIFSSRAMRMTWTRRAGWRASIVLYRCAEWPAWRLRLDPVTDSAPIRLWPPGSVCRHRRRRAAAVPVRTDRSQPAQPQLPGDGPPGGTQSAAFLSLPARLSVARWQKIMVGWMRC